MKNLLTITAAVLLSLFACSVDSIFDTWIVSAFGIAGLAFAFGAARQPDPAKDGGGQEEGYDKQDDHNPYPEE